MQITAAMVKELREKTGAGMMDCKKALNDAEGDIKKASEILREKGIASADKKAGRVAAEGVVGSYIHGEGRIGVLLEVNSETDFAAKTEGFTTFVKDIAMHIAATNPKYISREEVPSEEVESEREILKNQALNEGKPEKIIEKMINGRIDKFYKEICLMEQPFIRDTDITIEEFVKQTIGKIGENINIRRFVRYELGEGIEKKEDNFAEEVMAQTKR